MYKLEEFAKGFVFLEGPRWRNNKLYVSDMWDQSVHAITFDGTSEKIAEVPGRPSGLNFLADGRLIVVSMEDRKLYEIASSGSLEEYCDLSNLVSADINDSVVDSNGVIYVGNFGYDLFSGEAPKLASIVSVLPDKSCFISAEGLNFPNGCVIDEKRRVMIVAETFGHCLTAFDLSDGGGLSNKRVWADLGEHTPDGICLDADGAIWVSSFVTEQFIRVEQGGKILDKIDVAGRKAVACCLGGESGRILFALTYEGEIEDIGSNDRRNARIEVVEVTSAGVGSP